MGIRSVRLDEESESLLEEVRRTTGLSASAALKRGLHALRDELSREATRRPYDIYQHLDLGPGGYASGPSSDTRAVAKDSIRRKHRR